MDRITPRFRERERKRETMVNRVTQNSHRRTTCIGLGKMHQTNIHGKPRFRSVWVFRMLWLLIYNTKIRWVTILISSTSPEASRKHVDILWLNGDTDTVRSFFKSKFWTSAWYTIQWYKTVLCELLWMCNFGSWGWAVLCVEDKIAQWILEMEEKGGGGHPCKTQHLEIRYITWGQVTLISNIFTVGVHTYALDKHLYSCNFYFTCLLIIHFPCIITIMPFPDQAVDNLNKLLLFSQ
jgi:hypothetical protein